MKIKVVLCGWIKRKIPESKIFRERQIALILNMLQNSGIHEQVNVDHAHLISKGKFRQARKTKNVLFIVLLLP